MENVLLDHVIRRIEGALADMGVEAFDVREVIEIPPTPELGDYAFPVFNWPVSCDRSPDRIAPELAERIGKRRAHRAGGCCQSLRQLLPRTRNEHAQVVMRFSPGAGVRQGRRGSRTHRRPRLLFAEHRQAVSCGPSALDDHRAFARPRSLKAWDTRRCASTIWGIGGRNLAS